MCGILVNNASNEGFSDALNLLKHRGPDASATYSAKGVGFAHTTLALVDLDSRRNQPFWDQSNR